MELSITVRSVTDGWVRLRVRMLRITAPDPFCRLRRRVCAHAVCLVVAFGLAAALFLARPVGAQVTTAEVSGVVTDSSGAVIPGAVVTVTNAATGIARTVQTSAAGKYLVPLLQPGTYNIKVSSRGFRTEVEAGITLQVGQAAQLNFTLQVGVVSQAVEVKATPPLLQSQTSSLGSVINKNLVENLPLNGRNYIALAILTPGVNGVGYSTSGTIMSGTRPDDRRPDSDIFSNGNREGSNDYLYDGIDDNDRLTLMDVYRPGIGAIQEFQVETNLFNASLGRNSGAVINVVSNSGTNEFHGSAFEFLRNSAMDAANFFATSLPMPSFRFNQFGGSLGGPVILPKIYNGKDKTFFFVDYEGFRESQLVTTVTTVPTAAMRAGDFGSTPIYDPLTTTPVGNTYTRTEFVNNTIPSTRFDPVTAKLMNAYPLPQIASAINNYVSNMVQTQRWDEGDVRIDHQFTPSDEAFGRWSIQHTETVVPNTFPPVAIAGLPEPVSLGNENSFAGVSAMPVMQGVVDYVHVFSPHLVNDLRGGGNRFVVNYTAQYEQPAQNLGNALGVANSNDSPFQTVLPIFSPSNYAGIGQSRSLPIFRRENTFEGKDDVTDTIGAHTLKFGGLVLRRQITEYQTNQGNGRFNFNPAFTGLPTNFNGTGDSMASFLLGYPDLTEQDHLLVWDGARGTEAGLYVLDDYRVTPRLTLNLGLRWDYYGPYSEVYNRWGNFNLATGKIMLAGQNGVGASAGVNPDYRDYAPRVGFAYHAHTNWVVRGGFGVFYNPPGNGGVSIRLDRQVPFGPIYLENPGDIFVANRVSQGLPAAPTVNLAAANSPTGSVLGVAPDFKSAQVFEDNLTVEREIPSWNTLIRASYVGDFGHRLDTSWNPDQAVPGPGSITSRLPLINIAPLVSAVSYATSDGLSTFNAFELSVDKRMSQGLAIMLSYTYSHGLDDVGTQFGGGTGTPQNPQDRFADYGNADFDIRHRMTIGYTYALPFWKNRPVIGGWQTSGIVTLQTGLPFTPELASSTTNTGTGSRPNLVGDPVLPSGQRSIHDWFNVAAFASPPLYTFGNAARNLLYGPGRRNFDLSLSKTFAIRERLRAEFRLDGFNAFNTPQFGQPNGTIGSAQAPVISSTVGNPRQVQVSLNLNF